MKKILIFLGFGLMSAMVAYVLCRKQKDDVCTESEKDFSDSSIAHDAIIISPDNVQNDDAFVNIKASTIHTVSARHEAASKTMKDAVEIICKRSEVSADENRKLEQISEELDELLGGE